MLLCTATTASLDTNVNPSVAVEAVCVVSLNYAECDTATRNCATEWSLRVTATQLLKKRRHGVLQTQYFLNDAVLLHQNT